MNKLQHIMFLVLSFVLCAVSAQAQSPKQEFRSVWFQTVWAGDWPKSYDGEQQKKEFKTHLDRFERLGINAVCFQVRNMCDALYESKYEPWCQWLTGTRGKEPAFDPLKYLITEAHARGMELHVWINPYRFASSGTYSQSDNCEDYKTTHPEWIKYCDAAGIYVINPSDPTVRKRIVDVIMDIMDKYDIDGVIFDDYFYQSGYKDEYDNEFYKANNPKGLSRADWRREQVNLMVKEVHDAIKARAPWCRFGIGPAGVAASNADIAAKYGIKPCPSGSDWQYSGIYSEPIQWYVDSSLDYMAPQVYWPIGYGGGDYAKITPWWYEVAHHFGRHCFISQSLSGLTSSKIDAPLSSVTNTKFDAYQIVKQLQINYNNTRENAPGMVFFNASGFSKSNFITILNKEIWTHRAKVPAMTWFAAEPQPAVSGIVVQPGGMTWSSTAGNVRYGVYAIPKAKRNDPAVLGSSEYYLGMSYGDGFELPDYVTTADYALAVTVIDRYGFEWTPAFYGEQAGEAVKPELVSPIGGADVMLPAVLSWKAVPGAVGYTVQIAYQADFKNIPIQYQVYTNELFTAPFVKLAQVGTYYWRVCAHVPGAGYIWSDIQSYTGHPFSIVYPTENAENVPHAPQLQWETVAGKPRTYIVQIATDNTFRDTYIVYSDTTTATTSTVPEGALEYGKMYYMRVMTLDGEHTSAIVPFKTEKLVPAVPVIVTPVNESTVSAPTLRVEVAQTANNGYRFELCSDPSFPSKRGAIETHTTDMDINYTDYKKLKDGVYYLRAKTHGSAGYSDYSQVVKVTYTMATGLIDVEVLKGADEQVRKVWTDEGLMIIRGQHVFDAAGRERK